MMDQRKYWHPRKRGPTSCVNWPYSDSEAGGDTLGMWNLWIMMQVKGQAPFLLPFQAKRRFARLPRRALFASSNQPSSPYHPVHDLVNNMVLPETSIYPDLVAIGAVRQMMELGMHVTFACHAVTWSWVTTGKSAFHD